MTLPLGHSPFDNSNPFDKDQPFAPTDEPLSTDFTLHITDAAAQRLNAIFATKSEQNIVLRLTVTGGGCSGFQYKFDFDNQVAETDHAFSHNGATVVSDKQSMVLLTGSELDYVEDMMGSSFRIDNPAATISCGCGSSFNV